MRGIFMDYRKEINSKEAAETEFYDYRRIFYGDFNDNAETADKPVETDKPSIKKQREKKFITVFLAQSAICLTIICSALILKYAKPDTFQSVSSALNGFYEDNITLTDLNRLIDEKIMNNDAIAAFFNFTAEE
jgi:hypothetical protein